MQIDKEFKSKHLPFLRPYANGFCLFKNINWSLINVFHRYAVATPAITTVPVNATAPVLMLAIGSYCK